MIQGSSASIRPSGGESSVIQRTILVPGLQRSVVFQTRQILTIEVLLSDALPTLYPTMKLMEALLNLVGSDHLRLYHLTANWSTGYWPEYTDEMVHYVGVGYSKSQLLTYLIIATCRSINVPR
jgi:hypothetical protein